MRLLLDVDGVICNFIRGIAKHNGVDERWLAPNEFCITRGLGLDLTTCFYGVDYDFWFNLEPTPEADEIKRIVFDNFSRDKVSFTTVWPYPLHYKDLGVFCQARHDWLIKHGWMPHVGKGLMFGTSRHFAGNKSTLLIDDSFDNVTKFEEFGGQTILLQRPWNTGIGIAQLEAEIKWWKKLLLTPSSTL